MVYFPSRILVAIPVFSVLRPRALSLGAATERPVPARVLAAGAIAILCRALALRLVGLCRALALPLVVAGAITPVGGWTFQPPQAAAGETQSSWTGRDRPARAGRAAPGRASDAARLPGWRAMRPVTTAQTALVAFDVAPFPYVGPYADTGVPFFDVRDASGRRRGHTTSRGDVYWESETYGDRRVLLHIPAGFNPGRPALIVVYFHGQGATLERDVLGRQQVARQVTESGLNAVLVAPQFAVDAADSSSGNFWRHGVFARFLDEAARRLARLAGDPALAGPFRAAPVVLVAYSGGYQPAAFALDRGGEPRRMRGVILLDALYGHEDKFAGWIAAHGPAGFFASVATESTRENQHHLRELLQARRIVAREQLNGRLAPGTVVLADAGSKELHQELVTQGWVVDPVKTLLAAVPGYRRPAPPRVRGVSDSGH
jgi:hypothetical protein